MPTAPPAARDAPTSARSNPVSAPRASSIITQTIPPITSTQFSQLPTERLLALYVPRTIALAIFVFNDVGVKSREENVALSLKCYFRFFGFLRRFDLLLFDFFPGLASAASSRRFFAAQPGLFTCRPRAIPNPSAGTFSVIVEPAAIYAPLPIRTGAISA